ncbi:Uncharacterised protein [Mycobacteroides abscessus subsp. abscessus]|nr:Uncharacterised protein [Mycobacteroides abscessus subsp. abscessus]
MVVTSTPTLRTSSRFSSGPSPAALSSRSSNAVGSVDEESST